MVYYRMVTVFIYIQNKKGYSYIIVNDSGIKINEKVELLCLSKKELENKAIIEIIKNISKLEEDFIFKTSDENNIFRSDYKFNFIDENSNNIFWVECKKLLNDKIPKFFIRGNFIKPDTKISHRGIKY